MTTICENINGGIKVNKIFNFWLGVKTDRQYDKFKELVKNNMFGTYKNLSVVNIAESIGGGNANNIIRESFYREVSQILFVAPKYSNKPF